MLARRIADHRLAYLTYEGPISGGRGQCRIADAGQFHLLAETPDRIRFELAGGQASGVFELALVDRAAGLWRLARVPPAGGSGRLAEENGVARGT